MYRAADSPEPRRGTLTPWTLAWAVIPWITIATGLAMRALVSSRRGPGFAANTLTEWYAVHSVASGGAVIAVAALFLGGLVPAAETAAARVARWLSGGVVMVTLGAAAFVATRSSAVPDSNGLRQAMSLAWCTTGALLVAYGATVLRRSQTPERWVGVLVSGLVLTVAGIDAIRGRDARWVHSAVTVLGVAALVANADVDRVRTRRGAWVGGLLVLFVVARALTVPNALVFRLVVVLALYFAWACRPHTASAGASITGGFASLCLVESLVLRNLEEAGENDVAFADTLFMDAVSHLEAFMLLLALAAFLARDVSLTGGRRVIGGAVAVLLGLAVQSFWVALAMLGIRGMPRRYGTYPVEFESAQRLVTIAGIALTLLAVAWISVFAARRRETVPRT